MTDGVLTEATTERDRARVLQLRLVMPMPTTVLQRPGVAVLSGHLDRPPFRWRRKVTRDTHSSEGLGCPVRCVQYRVKSARVAPTSETDRERPPSYTSRKTGLDWAMHRARVIARRRGAPLRAHEPGARARALPR